jgi:hypothetical protein
VARAVVQAHGEARAPGAPSSARPSRVTRTPTTWSRLATSTRTPPRAAKTSAPGPPCTSSPPPSAVARSSPGPSVAVTLPAWTARTSSPSPRSISTAVIPEAVHVTAPGLASVQPGPGAIVAPASRKARAPPGAPLTSRRLASPGAAAYSTTPAVLTVAADAPGAAQARVTIANSARVTAPSAAARRACSRRTSRAGRCRAGRDRRSCAGPCRRSSRCRRSGRRRGRRGTPS